MKVEGILKVEGTWENLEIVIQGKAYAVSRLLKDIQEFRGEKKHRWIWTDRT